MKLIKNIKDNLCSMDFRRVLKPLKKHPECVLLLKKQTLNINRAIVVVQLENIPDNLNLYLKRLQKDVAFTVGFFPVFYGVGIQVIIISDRVDFGMIDMGNLVAVVDNQWAIVQSLFMIDNSKKIFTAIRTWGQVVTGPYQDRIKNTIETEYSEYTA